MRPSRANLMPVLIILGVILVVCGVRLWEPEIVERFERVTYDMRVRAALHRPAECATNLGFVYIDEATIRAVASREFGYSYGLYWPRQVYGRLVNELAAQGAKVTAFDVIFGELRLDHPQVQLAAGGLMESDEFFAQQMIMASNVVLAVTREVVPPPLFLTNAAGLGDISTEKDPDGILRRARAFRDYRKWNPRFLQAASDLDYGIDLNRVTVRERELVLHRQGVEDIRIPLDAEGRFELADFVGENLPPGMEPKAVPFRLERVWHMGVVLAAWELGLDLEKSEVDLGEGRIVLRGEGGLERVIPVDEDGYFYIDWCLPPRTTGREEGGPGRVLKQEAMHALLRQNQARLEGATNLDSGWKGKLAVIGSSAMGNDLTDRGATPLREDTLLVSKHWNVANSVITGRFVQRSPLWVDLALIAGLGLASGLLTWGGRRALVGDGLVLLLAVGYVVLSFVLYNQSRFWIPVVLPVVGALVMMYVSLLAWRVLFEQAEQRRVRSIFSTVVSPKIVKELLKAKALKLGGSRREITVMFADVRGFTAFTDHAQEVAAERVRLQGLTGEAAEAAYDEQAREALATVNLYLGVVAETVIRGDGTLDKFIGDCVMAFWGAPTETARHASQCVRAAIEAQRAIERLNREREEENRKRAAAGAGREEMLPILSLGTGINTGMATVGLMGSEAQAAASRQWSYTVFGREVNLAQRLESLSGHGRIFVSESTLERLRAEEPELAEKCIAHEPVAVKGIRGEVRVFEVPWKRVES